MEEPLSVNVNKLRQLRAISFPLVRSPAMSFSNTTSGKRATSQRLPLAWSMIHMPVADSSSSLHPLSGVCC